MLDSRSNQSNWVDDTPITYTFSSKTKYKGYRLNITGNNGDTFYTSIKYLEFIDDVTPLPSTSSVPELTSLTSGSGIAFNNNPILDGDSENDAHNVFDNPNEDSPMILTGGVPYEFGYIYPTPIAISSIIIQSGNIPNQAPKDFIIQGSTDTTNGSDGTWEDLSTISGETIWTINEERQYDFDVLQEYMGYKIKITSNISDNSNSNINHLRLIEGQIATGIPTEGLIAHYTFNESTISGNTIFDQSGNGNDLTSSNVLYGTTFMGEGIISNGSTTIMDTTLLLGAADFSVSFSYKHIGEIGSSMWLWNNNNGAVDAPEFIVYANGTFQLGSGISTETIKVYDGKLHNYIVTYNNSDNKINLYEDGKHIYTVTKALGVSQVLRIGYYFGQESLTSEGIYDNFRIYNVVLTPSAIEELSNEGNSNEDLVPPLTNNTSGGGLAFTNNAIYQGNDVLYGAHRIFDTDEVNTKMIIQGGLPYEYGYIFPSDKIVNKVKITIQNATRAPKDFKIQGSNDTTDGSDGTWNTLFSITGETGWVNEEERIYSFESNQAFIGFKIKTTDNQSDNAYASISNVELIENINPIIIPNDELIHYTFDSSTILGATINDQSGNGNDGTIIGHTKDINGYKSEGIQLESGVSNAITLPIQTDSEYTLSM